MQNMGISNVVIVGGGSAGWMAAAMLSKMLPPMISIKLIESEQIGTVGVGEATIPPIVSFNQALGLNEADFLKRTKGSFKLAIQFEGWKTENASYMHTFGDVGRANGATQFMHLWLRAKALEDERDLWHFSVNHRLARDNKFGKISRPNALLNQVAYAYHFDAGLYANLLREEAEKRQVERIEGTINNVVLAPDSGNISHVELNNGQAVHGDFFIDCSGFRSLLLGQALAVPFCDWQHWLPCDRAWAVQCESERQIRPYTRSIAHVAGWQWQIPLQHRIGNGMVYASQYWDDDAARDALVKNLPGNIIGEPRQLKFRTGRYQKQWHKNCLALGLASGFLEPLESTSLHLVQRGVARLIKLFPNHSVTEALADEYNRQSAFEFEHIRDFLILHYHVNERTNGEFWRYLREMPIPESLKHRIALFKLSGHFVRNADELFAESGWWQVMVGQGLMPQDYHRLADSQSDEQLLQYFDKIENMVHQIAADMPGHRDYLSASSSFLKS